MASSCSEVELARQKLSSLAAVVEPESISRFAASAAWGNRDEMIFDGRRAGDLGFSRKKLCALITRIVVKKLEIGSYGVRWP